MLRRVTIRNLLFIAVLLVAGGLLVPIVGNHGGSISEKPAEAPPQDADLSLKDIHYTETSGGVRRWTLTAQAAAYDAGQGKSTVQNVRLVFFGQRGQEQMTLTAREGTWAADAGELVARGGVVVKTPQGYTLYTEELIYRDRDKQIRSELPVRMVTDTAEITGCGLRFSMKNRSVRLLSRVKATLSGVAVRQKVTL
jgi:LPS export ABC transporter protein LptC